MSRYFKLGMLAVAAGAIYLAHQQGIELLPWAYERLGNFRQDAKALASGEYKERVAREYRKAAENNGQPLATTEDPALQKELAEARQKMLEERARALENKLDAFKRMDVEQLKQQTAANAKAAGGGN